MRVLTETLGGHLVMGQKDKTQKPTGFFMKKHEQILKTHTFWSICPANGGFLGSFF